MAAPRPRQAANTTFGKALALRHFFDFVVARYQGDIHALTGHLVSQPIDEFNRPSKAQLQYGSPRVPPSQAEVEMPEPPDATLDIPSRRCTARWWSQLATTLPVRKLKGLCSPISAYHP